MKQTLGILPLFAAIPLACAQPNELREWQPGDHDHATTLPAPAVSGSAPLPQLEVNIDEEVVDVWRLRCARCHGPSGHGNGPEGPLYNTPSLVRPGWLAQVTDEDLRHVITNGRGRMPAAKLSPNMLDGLVRLVRSLGQPAHPISGQLPPGHPPLPTSAPAPSPSASVSDAPAPAPSPSASVSDAPAPSPSTSVSGAPNPSSDPALDAR